MTIIVTGGAGFIGSNFIFHMLDKYPDYRIVCLDCLTYAGNLSTLAPVMDNPNFRFVKEKYGPYDHDIDVISKQIKEFEKYHKVKNTNEAYDILMKKLISETTLKKIEFYAPFISRAAAFTNHFSDSTSVEGAGTALFIIQQSHGATTEEIVAGFKHWSVDKAKRFSEASILSAINELEQAGFIQKTFCGYQIINN